VMGGTAQGGAERNARESASGGARTIQRSWSRSKLS